MILLEIGEFRHRITILKEEIGQNDLGDPIRVIVEVSTMWAKVSNVYGKEYFAAATVALEKMVVFTTRYIAGLNEKMFIRFQGKDYNIQFVDNIKYRNKYLEIKALLREVGSS